jgi:hypothetical protein
MSGASAFVAPERHAHRPAEVARLRRGCAEGLIEI